jgi:hypothetical protein
LAGSGVIEESRFGDAKAIRSTGARTSTTDRCAALATAELTVIDNDAFIKFLQSIDANLAIISSMSIDFM